MITAKELEAIATAVRAHTDPLKSRDHSSGNEWQDGFHSGYRYGVDMVTISIAEAIAETNPGISVGNILTACGI